MTILTQSRIRIPTATESAPMFNQCRFCINIGFYILMLRQFWNLVFNSNNNLLKVYLLQEYNNGSIDCGVPTLLGRPYQTP